MKMLNQAAASAALALAAGTAAAQTELNIAHVLGDTSSYQIASERLAELVAERTDGEVVINVFNQGALGGELKLTQGLRTGTVDLAFISTASLENTIPEMKVFSLPYLFTSKAEAYDALAGAEGQALLEVFENYGILGLGWGAIYERSTPSTSPITTVEDFDGTKIRVIQAPGWVQTYEALGAQATPLAYGELFLALQNGIVDAAELAPDQTVGDGFAEVITDYTFTRIHQLPSLMLGSAMLSNKLTDEQLAIVRDAAAEALADGIAAHDDATEAAVETMTEQGIAIHEPDLAPFIEQARTAWPGLIEDIPGGMDMVDRLSGGAM
ncbi:TRAP transporter substrate-binding protein [Meridianimarinicoccus sp. RP-17]|uniref:TRAP transporter substrate-binding protein n=1 Tax=Meridianimarinicoccus zhengii TaxID=2056810 RepID=UPI001F3BC46A|nr:TRAP transporter substrate-binding protein [Phycocomes zhengii]